MRKRPTKAVATKRARKRRAGAGRKRPKMPRRTVSLLALVALFLRRRSKGIKADDAARIAKCSLRTAHRLLAEMKDAGLLVGGGRQGYLLRRVPGAPRR